MRLLSSELERFLRNTVDSGVVVRSTLGLGMGQTGVAFQYQSSEKLVMVFFEFATAGALILAPLYAPRESVEEIIARETFRDDELDRLSEIHHHFLLWLREALDDENLEASDGRFFSKAEPLPEEISQVLQNMVPLASYISVMGYPEGTIHIFTDLSPDDLAFPDLQESSEMDAAEELETDVPEASSSQSFIQWVIGLGLIALILLLALVQLEADDEPSLTAVSTDAEVKPKGPRWKVAQVRIPHGSFIMGCTGEACAENESPHRVTLSSDYFMMESEVTQELYTKVMKENPSQHYQCGPLCPAENVSWVDAVAFANRLSVNHEYTPCYYQEGARWLWNTDCTGWRLPTEAEWEYAALGLRTDKGEGEATGVKVTAVEKTAWHLSDKELHQVPSAIGMSEEKRLAMARLLVQSHSVCQKPKNGYGLCDMSGNVWEWTWDWYEPSSAVYHHNGVDPKGPELGRTHVLKGGSFASVLPNVKPHRRAHLPPWATMGDVSDTDLKLTEGTIGFRLVRTAQ